MQARAMAGAVFRPAGSSKKERLERARLGRQAVYGVRREEPLFDVRHDEKPVRKGMVPFDGPPEKRSPALHRNELLWHQRP